MGNPTCILASQGDGWGNLAAENPVAILKTDSLAEIEEFAARHKGQLLIGYLSYDFGCSLHGVNLSKPEAVKAPGALIFAFDSWQDYVPPAQTGGPAYTEPLKPVWPRGRYGEAFRRVKDYLVAGDAYQVNLAQRLGGKTGLGGQELFARLSAGSQANFQAYLDCGDFEVLSLSPERFIKVEGRDITTMPIKGTRPRGQSEDEDQALKRDLLDSPKDKAELNMITDLLRNDLGEVCAVGSIKVAETRTITGYPTVWHAHSLIAGELRPDVSPIAALASMSPGGSISGCPKKRALEVIDELEPERRGIYTGTIFKITPDGSLDSSIAIRTMIKQGEDVHLSVGGGIVYDSEEASEYQETLDKAAAFLFEQVVA